MSFLRCGDCALPHSHTLVRTVGQFRLVFARRLGGGPLQEEMAGLTQPLRGCPPGEHGAEASACSVLPAPGSQRMPRARRDVPASEPCCWARDRDRPQCPEECTLCRRGLRASSTCLGQSGHAERGCTSARTGGAHTEPVSPFRVLGWRTASTWGDVAATVAPGPSLCWSWRAEEGRVAASPVPAERGSSCLCLGRAMRTAAQSSGPRPYQHSVYSVVGKVVSLKGQVLRT